MNICILGAGYVGLVNGVCFAEKGNDVRFVDIDESKIESLRKNIIPIYEPGLEELVLKNSREGRLRFLTDLNEGLDACQMCFIAVATPQSADGSTNMTYVQSAADSLGDNASHDILLVIKSTVPAGTNAQVQSCIDSKLTARGLGKIVEVVSCPEFLKEGMAIEDCMNPDRVVIGTVSAKACDIMRSLYSPFVNEDRILFMDPASAEIAKYAANTMLASRISLMNEISRLCDAAGADIVSVKRGISWDRRIGPSFLNAGCGYGGSCFPKDVRSLASTGQKYGLNMAMVNAIDTANNEQKNILPAMIKRRFGEGTSGLKVAVLGLSFKPHTDDMREAPSISLIERLLEYGARVVTFDPAARERAAEILPPSVSYAESAANAVEEADAAALVTEWPEFGALNWFEIGRLMKQKIFFDGRNMLDPQKMEECGFEYYCIGRGRSLEGLIYR
jgi:UDPglucose 6-dehydrogenase